MKNKKTIIGALTTITIFLIILAIHTTASDGKIGVSDEEIKYKTIDLKSSYGSIAVFDESTLEFTEGGGSEIFYLRQVPNNKDITNMKMQLEGTFTTEHIGSFNDSYCLSSGTTYNAYVSQLITLDVSQINDIGIKARVNCEDKIGVWWVFGNEGDIQCNVSCNPFCKTGSINSFCPPTNAAGTYICDGTTGCGNGCSGGFDKIFNIDTRNQDEITIFMSAFDPGTVYYYSSETRCPGSAWVNVLFSLTAEKYEISYPHDISLDIGNDGTTDWQWTGRFDKITTPIDINLAIKEYMENNCQTATCDVPVVVNSGGSGKIKISEVTYDIEDRGYIGMAQDNWWALIIILIFLFVGYKKISKKRRKK